VFGPQGNLLARHTIANGDNRRRYGYRRITAELHRRGMQVNHERVVRNIGAPRAT
jgi:hypothetical protein